MIRAAFPLASPLPFIIAGWLTLGTVTVLAVDPVPGVKEPKFLLSWGKKGDQPGEFHSPIGIAINRRDEIFVSDVNNARVQKFSRDGHHLGGFDLPWDKPPRRSSQCGGIAVDAAGLIYLTFMSQHRVIVYTETGKLVRE